MALGPASSAQRQCQLQASENFHLDRTEERKSTPILWQQKDAASLAMTRPPFQPAAAGLSSDRRPGERHEIDQLNRRRSPGRGRIGGTSPEKSPRTSPGPGTPHRHGYWKALNTMQPKACDISSVSRKRHENAISYGFSPDPRVAAPVASAKPSLSPRVRPSDTGRREEYFESAESAVQFSPDCTFHHEVMEHRRDARNFAKKLGRPGDGSRVKAAGRSGAAPAQSAEGETRVEPAVRQRMKPGLPDAARGTLRSPSPKTNKGTASTVELLEKLEIDPRELMLKDLKCRVDELVKQTGLLHQLHSTAPSPRSAGRTTRSPRKSTGQKKHASPSGDMGSPATVSTASPVAASPLSTSLAPAARW